MNIFKSLESDVRSYCRSFPCVFQTAQGEYLYDQDNNRYLDFLAGCGTLNYGHNNPVLKEKLLAYIGGDGLTHGLDVHTTAKAGFLKSIDKHILQPRSLRYKVQFPGPTGTNAVEAALKIARKVKQRDNIIAFTNGFHGVTLGALAATGNKYHRGGAGTALSGVMRLPYDGYLGEGIDSTVYLDKVLSDGSSGVDQPAAVIVETVQGEGGLTAARLEWLRNLQQVCRKHDVLLIIDDIQAGCGRTGTFFSFEEAGISPDIITLSKSLSGYGLPFAIVLLKPELDQWKPGEHNGTFRGNNLAFVTAKAAIEHYWADDSLTREVRHKGDIIGEKLKSLVNIYGEGRFSLRGRGMFRGINCVDGNIAGAITRRAFKRGLILETSGADGEVIKILCALTIAESSLNAGLEILEHCFREYFYGQADSTVAAQTVKSEPVM